MEVSDHLGCRMVSWTFILAHTGLAQNCAPGSILHLPSDCSSVAGSLVR